MSTANDNKKGMSSATSTTKPDNSKDQAAGSKKGMDQKDGKEDMKDDRHAKSPTATSKTDKDSDTKNIKNK